MIRHTVIRCSGEIRQRGKVTSISLQLAHLTLLLASLLPLGSPLTSLLLRLGLVTHSSLLTAWALLTPACSLDSLTWALTLLAVNTTLLLRSGLTLASLHCSAPEPEVRAAYDTLFRPLGVDRKQFKVSQESLET